jgi:S-ribosylhomocysteine lyase LuxS involved in autoinducer biosynthesis
MDAVETYLAELEEVDLCIHVPSEKIVQQEDGHMILDHLIATTLRGQVEAEAERVEG